MSRVLLCSVLGLGIIVAAVHAQNTKADPMKEEPAKTEFIARVKAVDAAKNTVTVMTTDDKELILRVEKTTKILGPQGGVSKARLKDDRLVKGADVTVTLAPDGKTAREIKLSLRAEVPKKK